MVVLIAGAGAKVGGFESYIEAGGTVVVIYDKLDPVVLRSRALLPALGNMQSPPNIDGNRPYVVPNAGHSGLLERRNEVISRELGVATRNQLDSSGRVIRYTPGAPKRSHYGGSGGSEIEYPYLNPTELQGVAP